MKFSVIIPIYNEENRVRYLLDSIVGYVDEVIVINKSSIDNSKVIINDLFGEAVRVIDVPYSRRGEDDFKSYCNFANNDWVFFCVASEIVPIKFWQVLNKINETVDLSIYDLIMVPRQYNCFGHNVPGSPWDVSFFPFFFNKRNVFFTNKMHAHFSVFDERKRYYMSCCRSVMIQHYTHTSLASYLESTKSYASYEIDNIKPDDLDSNLNNWICNMHEGYLKLKGASGYGALAHYAAWNIYWSVHILKLLESKMKFSTVESNDNLSVGNNKTMIKLGLKKGFILHLKIIFNKFLQTNVYFRNLKKLFASKWGRF